MQNPFIKHYPFFYSNTLSFLIKPVVSLPSMGFETGITSQLKFSDILPTKSRKKQYSSLVWRNKMKGHMSVSMRESPFLPFSDKTAKEKNATDNYL